MEDSFFNDLTEAVSDLHARRDALPQHKYELADGSCFYSSTALTKAQLAAKNAAAMIQIAENKIEAEKVVNKFMANCDDPEMAKHLDHHGDDKFDAIIDYVQERQKVLIDNLDDELSYVGRELEVGKVFTEKAAEHYSRLQGTIVELIESQQATRAVYGYYRCQWLLEFPN